MNYLAGGKLGDLMYALSVPAYRYKIFGESANIYLADKGDHFSAGLEKTFLELCPIMFEQVWCNGLELYTNQPIDHDLTTARQHPKLFFQPFLTSYFELFCDNHRPPLNFKWFEYNGDTETYGHTLVINRQYPITASAEKYLEELKKHKSAYFLNPEFLSLSQVFSIISGCKIFMGDQSSCLAIAQALGKPRIAELNRRKEFLVGDNTDMATYFSNGYAEV